MCEENAVRNKSVELYKLLKLVVYTPIKWATFSKR